jgi:hypothetical protein
VIQARRRDERAWQLQCAIATAAAQTEQGQDYVQTLWAALQDSGTASDDDGAAEAEAAEIEQAQAQARLDGLVRQVKVSRDE